MPLDDEELARSIAYLAAELQRNVTAAIEHGLTVEVTIDDSDTLPERRNKGPWVTVARNFDDVIDDGMSAGHDAPLGRSVPNENADEIARVIDQGERRVAEQVDARQVKATGSIAIGTALQPATAKALLQICRALVEDEATDLSELRTEAEIEGAKRGFKLLARALASALQQPDPFKRLGLSDREAEIAHTLADRAHDADLQPPDLTDVTVDDRVAVLVRHDRAPEVQRVVAVSDGRLYLDSGLSFSLMNGWWVDEKGSGHNLPRIVDVLVRPDEAEAHPS